MAKMSGLLRVIALLVALFAIVQTTLTHPAEGPSNNPQVNAVSSQTDKSSIASTTTANALPTNTKWITLYDINKADAIAEAQSTLLLWLFLPLMLFFLSTAARQFSLANKALLLLIGLGFSGVPILFLWSHFSLLEDHNKGDETIFEGPVEGYRKIPIKDGYAITFKIKGQDVSFECIPFHGPGLSRLSDDQLKILSNCKAAKAWIPKKWSSIARLDVVE